MNLTFSQSQFDKNLKSKLKKEEFYFFYSIEPFIDALGQVSAAENVVFTNRNVYCIFGLFLLL